MPLRTLHEANGFVFRESGNRNAPPLVYLPGVHGCWTPLNAARQGLEERFHLIEIAYPPKPKWTLVDYAQELAEVLEQVSLTSAHLVGESFGSLVAWQFAQSRPTAVRSHILLGGFVQSPSLYRAALARLGLRLLPSRLFGFVVDRYVDYRAVRVEHADDVEAGAYPAVRNRSGRLATARRMQIIQHTDMRCTLSSVDYPVRYIGGANDTVVQVAREVSTLAELLPPGSDFEFRLIAGAPHMIIASHSSLVVDELERWVSIVESQREKPYTHS